MSGDGRLDGKVALITGAARGIGAEVARQLAARGARIALVGLEPELLEQTARACGPDAFACEADVTDWTALEAAVKRVVERFGGIDLLIANAGIAPTGTVLSIDPAAFERTIAINLVGVWRTVRLALPHLIDRRGYCLVVSSLAAIAHGRGMAAYSASKAGCEAFANSLRLEVAPMGVDVGVAYFSFIATDLLQGAEAARAGLPPPLRRAAPVSEAAAAIVDAATRRATAVHLPGWLFLLKWIRGALNPLVAALGRSRSSRR